MNIIVTLKKKKKKNNNNNYIYKAHWSHHKKETVQGAQIYTLYPFREFGPPYLGKATAAASREQRYPVLQVHAGSFCVCVIHRTLTGTTGYLTFNVLT